MQDDETQPDVEPDEERDPEAEESEQAEPDEESGPLVEPVEGDQGQYVEQTPMGANPGVDTGYDPDRPRRTSPPDPSQQEGVARSMTGGGNEDVERDESQVGPQDPPVPGA